MRAIVDLHAHRSVCATVLSYNGMIRYDMIRHYYFTRTPYSTQSTVHGKIRASEACHPAIPVPPFGRPHRPGPMSCKDRTRHDCREQDDTMMDEQDEEWPRSTVNRTRYSVWRTEYRAASTGRLGKTREVFAVSSRKKYWIWFVYCINSPP